MDAVSLLRPRLYSRGVVHLDFAALAAQGLVNYCLDVDNTLALHLSWEPAPGVPEALRRAREEGHIRNLCLVSNVIWGRRKLERLAHLARRLDIPHHCGALLWHRKPSPVPFRRAMACMGSTPDNTVVVGDQIFTDILGGNRLGLYTVLVQPLGPDHWTTFFSARRRREQALLRQFGMTPV